MRGAYLFYGEGALSLRGGDVAQIRIKYKRQQTLTVLTQEQDNMTIYQPSSPVYLMSKAMQKTKPYEATIMYTFSC